jgi:hypothetical protein
MQEAFDKAFQEFYKRQPSMRFQMKAEFIAS